MDGLFPHIFHGERSELREKYRLVFRHGLLENAIWCRVAVHGLRQQDTMP
jgi:hypothetical protein